VFLEGCEVIWLLKSGDVVEMEDSDGDYYDGSDGSDGDYDGEGGYEHPDIPVQAERYSEADEQLEPFLAAIYAFKQAVNAAFHDYDTESEPSNTRGPRGYMKYIRAIQSLWDEKSRRLRTSLTAHYDVLPSDVRELLQKHLNEIHSANTPEHEFVQNHWIKRLFVECAGSSNMRSFEACKVATK
jgi:hypothetical protein